VALQKRIKNTAMTEQERNELLRFMEEYIQNMDTEEKVIAFFQEVGILDENGNLTEHYQHLPLCFTQNQPIKEAI
jgi:uncharacterized protein YnzC (UPF0291/DUF896 family)